MIDVREEPKDFDRRMHHNYFMDFYGLATCKCGYIGYEEESNPCPKCGEKSLIRRKGDEVDKMVENHESAVVLVRKDENPFGDRRIIVPYPVEEDSVRQAANEIIEQIGGLKALLPVDVGPQSKWLVGLEITLLLSEEEMFGHSTNRSAWHNLQVARKVLEALNGIIYTTPAAVSFSLDWVPNGSKSVEIFVSMTYMGSLKEVCVHELSGRS